MHVMYIAVFQQPQHSTAYIIIMEYGRESHNDVKEMHCTNLQLHVARPGRRTSLAFNDIPGQIAFRFC